LEGCPGSGENQKLPLNPVSHTPASVTDPATWTPLDVALTALKSGKGATGLGFVLSENDPFTGIDIDNCIEHNRLTPEASDIVTDLWSYYEISWSRKGIHIFVEGTVPTGRRKNGIEIYSKDRFLVLTTNQVQGAPDTIEPRQKELDKRYASLSPVKTQEQHFTTPSNDLFIRDDYTVIEKANAAKNGAKFTRLYQGNTEGFTSHSEAAFTLILLLLYWTNDNIDQVERLYKQSGLYNAKDDILIQGKTYLHHNIENALKKRRR
jgi:primase-polymerase (primpol)-like protein